MDLHRFAHRAQPERFRRPAPTRRALPAAALLTVALAGLSGCGSDSPEDTVTPQDAPSPSTDLTVTVVDGEKTTWTLTCDPVGGTHPDAAAACAALEKNGEQSLPPVAADQMCTQIFGGEQTATITGTWKGEKVDASFSRTDGCQISRWEALAPLLPRTSGA
ncbi:SSI family serine proteinase inhibitor [Kineosporia succinea]|uniref:Subtilisin inhibitor domain-containing protein n=1 Tax=Kineosporia succinea TaxID=84632 RepID=A0ABT9P0S0_9ACTN|nr:SSI family serine proteinase inhibitor [Kineosporia succinea]MDP9826273.1 hypothetical protein [Kineosporia succinea]